MITNLDYIKSNLDIVSIIENYLPLKKAGANYLTACPFHDENTPSLIINKSKNLFHCFGCGEGGNALDFIIKYEKLDFNNAVKKACSICNLDIKEEQSKKQSKDKETQERLQNFYDESLKELLKHEKLLNYLAKRGFKGEVLESYGLGYCLSSERIKEILGDSLAYSLGFFTEKGYNFFQNRLLLCIRNEREKIVGFSGRLFEDSSKHAKTAKYINSKESELYKKNSILYNYTNALNILNRTKAPYIYIVEGYFDALTCNLLEIPSVSIMSASIHLNQLKLLTKLLKDDTRIHIALDSDEAGRSGSIRAYKMLLQYGYLESKISRLDKSYKDLNEFYTKSESPIIPFKHFSGMDFSLKVELGLAKSIKAKNEILDYYKNLANKANDIFTKNYILKHLNKYLIKPLDSMPDKEAQNKQNQQTPQQEAQQRIIHKRQETEILTQLAQDKQKRYLIKDLLNANDFIQKDIFTNIINEKETKEIRELLLQSATEQDLNTFYKIALRYKTNILKKRLSKAIKDNNINYIHAINLKLQELNKYQEIPF